MQQITTHRNVVIVASIIGLALVVGFVSMQIGAAGPLAQQVDRMVSDTINNAINDIVAWLANSFFKYMIVN